MKTSTSKYRERYKFAERRVKRLKGFYTHLIIYIIINSIIVFSNIKNLDDGESYFQWHNFISLSVWGMFLLIHAASVFIPNFIFGVQWEERKIREFMENER
ncbi:2TM domain-containing protein [Psychroserpens luteolus]|uniref:2TM domain-containing protein n=1 Tax=Psychroserpens luteolus TaxID=2855840 RepID=UPI001E3B1537|nr:2TM domain-containing protein [Psychroserpens luteolus]MCD2259847.1 2TM domain-containing protein [Psychroserpens luteolus]